MTASPQLLLAVDHRRSFERLFGITGPVDESTRRRLAGAKMLVVDAVTSVAAMRPDHTGLGLLLDDEFGRDAVAAARRAGLAIAVAFERSGRDVLEFEHEDWRQRLAGLEQASRSGRRAGDGPAPDTFAKVLVRYRADGDEAAHAVQLARLREISDACADSLVRFMVEVIAPFTDRERSTIGPTALETSLRPRLVVEAMSQMQAAGVAPDVWKVEGVADIARCAAIAAQARSAGGLDVGIVVLGAGAGDDTVATWLRCAANAGYSGFAVGRSIWADALLDHHAGVIDAATARQRIASKYVAFVDTFCDALP